MSKFVLSCTTCATRRHELDEISECFIHAPRAGYKAWGVAGPLFQTPGLMQWANYDLLNRRAAEAGLTRCTEVYGRSFPTGSVAEAVAAARDRVLVFEAAEKLGSPLVVMTGRERTPGGMGQPSRASGAAAADREQTYPAGSGAALRLADPVS